MIPISRHSHLRPELPRDAIMATSAHSDYVAGPSPTRVEPEALTRYSALALAFSIVGMSTDPDIAK